MVSRTYYMTCLAVSRWSLCEVIAVTLRRKSTLCRGLVITYRSSHYIALQSLLVHSTHYIALHADYDIFSFPLYHLLIVSPVLITVLFRDIRHSCLMQEGPGTLVMIKAA